MMDIIVWMIAITVIVLSIINKDSFPAIAAYISFFVVALSIFTYQIIVDKEVPDSYYGYLSFSNFVAVIAVLLFILSRLMKLHELKSMGMSILGFWVIVMSLINLGHRYWGYGYISYFHLILLLAGVIFYVAERWESIAVFKVLAIILANVSFFYLVYMASKLDGGITYTSLSQATVMDSGLLTTCIVFFSYYLSRHNIISEKHANRFLGVGVSLMAAGTVYLHPDASAIAFKPFQNIKGMLAMGNLSAVAYGIGITVFAKTKLV